MPDAPTQPRERYVLGVDVGGTFTDVICAGAHRIHMRKTPSRPDDPGQDVMQAFADIAVDLGEDGPRSLLRKTALIVHGSTVATNTLLTRSGARVGLITTSGFRDIVEMRGGIRESTFDSHLANADPLAPRPMRSEVEERVDKEGEAHQEPDPAAIASILRRLRSDGMEALAIAFKHSSANPTNEQKAGEIARQLYPDLFVSESAVLSRRARLYDRTSTAVVNSHIGPLTAEYIGKLLLRLQELDFSGQLLIMSGSGGVISPEHGRRMPAQLILSGPAAGPVAAVRSGTSTRPLRDAIVIDMGGTSFDVSVLRDGHVAMAASRDVNRHRISVPMLDIHTVGAGGGSIAWVDHVGLLQVGPRSAGAIPGPAAYGRGGTEPTVTDANLVLGLLDPDSRLGGRQALSLPKARSAVARVARRLGLTVEQTAGGIREVANGAMTAAIREVTLGRGIDPRLVPLLAGGGAGPLHAAELAASLGIQQVIVPWHAGVLCALGMAMTDVRYETVVSLVRNVEDLRSRDVGTAIDRAKSALADRMADLRGEIEGVSYAVEVEARYRGQFHELVVPMEEGELDGPRAARFIDRFHRSHNDAYGFASESTPVEVVAIVIRVSARLKNRVEDPAGRQVMGFARKATRQVGRGGAEMAVPVYAPTDTSAQESRVLSQRGPLLIDLPTTTVWVPPEWAVSWQTGNAFELVHE